ncbi:ATP-binding protein [Streptomyces mirabilis]|uniref:ATP-binding protein n=1 Tax=Streptomyces mirabilis TaxID=68239 RepID=UPI0036A29B45
MARRHAGDPGHGRRALRTGTRPPPSTGSGLGLSIVAAIAAAHGGTVTLEPTDRGAWFRVRLPAGP